MTLEELLKLNENTQKMEEEIFAAEVTKISFEDFKKRFPDIGMVQTSIRPCTHEWINIKNKFPEPMDLILLFDGKEINTGWLSYFDDYDNPVWFYNHVAGRVYNVTHWMNFPLPPKEEKNNENI
jgi:hypothetical protein